jgi:hypothetical protein
LGIKRTNATLYLERFGKIIYRLNSILITPNKKGQSKID